MIANTRIIGLDSFIAGLDVAKDATKKMVEAVTLELALDVRRKAQIKVPKRTSILAQSIVAEPVEYGAQTTVGEKYGVYVEDGTGLYDPFGSHLIYAKSGGPLHWESDGEDHYAMWTRGMEAQPFFWPAVDEMEPTIKEKMGIAADSLIRMAVKE